ncbi:hypothetical protein AOX56_11130 [Aeromonas sobria]|uniref:Uncharacterized protein n=1 Tax=Aeromonas sobria TaxID=646 RepID=A0A2N3J479_AERSO|nr:hypothetical protein AOX56_11130 [Aeromonas sobria]
MPLEVKAALIFLHVYQISQLCELIQKRFFLHLNLYLKTLKSILMKELSVTPSVAITQPQLCLGYVWIKRQNHFYQKIPLHLRLR